MSGNSSKLLNVVGLLASCAVACACTGGAATPAAAAMFATAAGIAGNVGAEHFSKLFSFSGLNFFGKKAPSGLHAELRKSLIAAVSLALEQIKREYPNPLEMAEVEEIIASWKSEAVKILESGQASVTAWNQLVIGETSLKSTLSDLGMELYVPNEEYGQSEFRLFFLENFPVIFATHFQAELEKKQEAWLTWEVLQSKAHQKAILEIAQSLVQLKEQQKLILEKLAAFQLSAENTPAQRSEFWNTFEVVWKEVQEANLYDKIFIFCSKKDRIWVERELIQKLVEANISTHFDFRGYLMTDAVRLFPNILQSRKTVVVFSEKFAAGTENLLLQGFASDQRFETTADKILILRTDDSSVPTNILERLESPFSLQSSISGMLEKLKSDLGIAPARPVYPPPDEKYVDVTALPHRGASDHLFGRQAELRLLDEAWDDPDTRVITFVAQGGVGKSALVSRWVADMAKDNYRGAERVLATSFYSQGTTDRIASSDLWMNEALRWFGEAEYDTRSPWDKGKRLAQLVNEHRTLLLLDGLEPMQEGGQVGKGTVKDPALNTLIRQLARRNRGLCVITTREVLGGFERFEKNMRSHQLENISDEAGIKILSYAGHRGVQGSMDDLIAAIHEFGNHAYAINLLGSYLYAHPGHKAALYKEIPDLPDVPVEKGKHPRRVIAALGKKLANDGKHEAVKLMESLGFFDRPVPREVIKVISDFDDLSEAIAELREQKLVYKRLEHAQEMVDCHPLVREHFEEVLQGEQGELWQQGNEKLYRYYEALPEKHQPDTLEDMEPLFRAVMHGCRAGMHQRVLLETYFKRIQRDAQTNYCCHQLGAYNSDLQALSWMFSVKWHLLVNGLDKYFEPFVFSWAGYRLRALNRPFEAINAMNRSSELELAIYQTDKHQLVAGSIAFGFENLSQTNLLVGEIGQSIIMAEKSLHFGLISKNKFQIEKSYAITATSYYQQGEREIAYKNFITSEKLQCEREYVKYMYSIKGFYFCELLLELKELDEVCERAKYSLKFSLKNNWLLDIALDNLSLGNAYLSFFKYSPNDEHSQQAAHCLDDSVQLLRRAGTMHHLPRALLARAAYHRITQNYPAALEDLEEVLDIAEPSGMRLHLTDYHLEMARLCLAMSEEQPEKLTEAKEHTELAAQLVEDTGYHRRDGEVAELREKLENLPA